MAEPNAEKKAIPKAVSNSVILSGAALVIALVAFFVLYATIGVHGDAFWSVLCLYAVVPATLIAGFLLAIRDIVKRRSWLQIVASIVMIVSSACLVWTSTTVRFYFHQLFTFRPVDFGFKDLQPGPVFFREFRVCPEGQACDMRSKLTEKDFSLKSIPEDCCVLSVMNSRSSGSRADSFQVVLNGKTLKPAGADGFIMPVELQAENKLAVRVSGNPDAHVFLIITANKKRLDELKQNR